MCIFNRKCKFWKNCNCFRRDSDICTKTEGNFYGSGFDFRPGGCYRSIEEKGKFSSYWLDDKTSSKIIS
jgi:hypothetical protein